MKKTAVVIDFDPKLKEMPNSTQFDFFILDRYHDKITDVVTSKENEFSDVLHQEMMIYEFYDLIASHYKEVLFLFLSYKYTDVDDHLITQSINQKRSPHEAKLFTYLLNYNNSSKYNIILNTLEMIEKGYEIREIIIRIHQIRKNESFLTNNSLLKYISLLV